jgi:Carboxypeptidase regulatory-like domain
MHRVVLLLVAGLLAVPAFAKELSTVQIKVTNLSGKPVDRASVVVKFVKGRSAIKMGKKQLTHWETRTNDNGLVKLPQMPQGEILVQVIAKGYQTFGQKYDVDEDDKTIEIKLNPPQPQYSAHE